MSLLLHLKSSLATTLTNSDGSHSRPASHHDRVEGWTEVFGNKNKKISSGNGNGNGSGNSSQVITSDEKCDFGYNWRLDDYYVLRTRNAQVHQSMMKNPPPIRLHQYRPSYDIQLFLRLSSTPHLIFNSPNHSTESNGQLPTLIDLDHNASIGIQTPTNTITNSRMDGVFSYLLDRRNNNQNSDNGHDNVNDNDNDYVNDDIISLSDGQKSQRNAIMSQYHELRTILKCLRYGHDTTWDELYRKQCIKAHLYPNGDSDEMAAIGAESYYEKSGWSFVTWFQIWAERVLAQKEIQLDSLGKLLFDDRTGVGGGNGKEVNINKATVMAGEIYESLDWKLGQSTNVNGYLLDTEELSLIDVLLFGHLAEALCDIHLVVILINYKNLISFFQNTYESYFGKEYQVKNNNNNSNANANANANVNANTNNNSRNDLSWIKWNDRVNALNQFNRIPMNDVERKIRETLDSGGNQNAIQIMQSVALHCHDLREVLADVAILRKQEDELYGADNVPKTMAGRWLHKLRMGGDLDMSKVKEEEKKKKEDKKESEEDEMTKKRKEHTKKIIREAKRNDELWISATICATVFGLLASSKSSAD